MFKNRYQYTCPDVINYRKNQYRLYVGSTLLSFAYIAAFWAVLTSAVKKSDTEFDQIIENLENQE